MFIFFAPALIALLTATGGMDALDLAPSDLYWREKQVTVSVEAMLAELHEPEAAGGDAAALIAQLGDSSFEKREAATRQLAAMGPAILPQLQEATAARDLEVVARAQQLIEQIEQPQTVRHVRRLMAIRTLGELKDARALPTLKALANSQELFVADYARRASAAIENEAFEPLRVGDKELMADVWMLPAECAAVGQFRLDAGAPITLEQIFRRYTDMMQPLGMAPLDEQQRHRMLRQQVEQAAGQLIGGIEMINNVRIDSITIGVSGDVNNESGFVVAVIRGEYDGAALRRMAQEQGTFEVAEVDGIWTMDGDNAVSIIMPDHHRCIIVAGPDGEQRPAAAFLAALKQDRQPLKENKELAAMVEAIDKQGIGWSVMRPTEHYQNNVPQLSSFDAVRMTATRDANGTISWQATADGGDAGQAQAVADEINAGIQETLVEIRQAGALMPMAALQSITAALQSIRTDVDAGNLTVRGNVPADLLEIAAASVVPMLTGMMDMPMHDFEGDWMDAGELQLPVDEVIIEEEMVE